MRNKILGDDFMIFCRKLKDGRNCLMFEIPNLGVANKLTLCLEIKNEDDWKFINKFEKMSYTKLNYKISRTDDIKFIEIFKNSIQEGWIFEEFFTNGRPIEEVQGELEMFWNLPPMSEFSCVKEDKDDIEKMNCIQKTLNDNFNDFYLSIFGHLSKLPINMKIKNSKDLYFKFFMDHLFTILLDQIRIGYHIDKFNISIMGYDGESTLDYIDYDLKLTLILFRFLITSWTIILKQNNNKQNLFNFDTDSLMDIVVKIATEDFTISKIYNTK
jgi:hypothetical protein